MTKKNNEQYNRPWGFYEVLADEKDHKVKRITVYPEKRMSLQLHKLRSEHWFIVKGIGLATIGKENLELAAGQSVDIIKETAHRIKNTGSRELVLIEVQTGDYFGEDDILRIEDDYGRI